jgi:hypothetical protein
MALEIIICLPDVLKNDFREVDVSMFKVVERPCELIFCILRVIKGILDEVLEVMF